MSSLIGLVSEGGLGFRSLSLMMKLFRMKSVWNILTKECLYENYTRERYIIDDNVRDLTLLSTVKKI